ncbi:hypothetical protein Ahy_A02g007464 [Arachis hypogaea]|uniref:Uncharacterized protein n=1 Tax=Arachis hypogaea TaxID=3818 RepID=A0A445EC85_ARAHY|nr:hypothetical protein Ahy_A02g007464 [Arachis hypogaea]
MLDLNNPYYTCLSPLSDDQCNVKYSVNSSLQNMTSLVHLDLAGNNLTPSSSWSDNFEKLEYLDLSFCGLGQIFDSFRNITSIESLFLRFEKLKRLDLSRYEIHQIPNHLTNISSIEYLYLVGNEFDFFTSMSLSFENLKF